VALLGYAAGHRSLHTEKRMLYAVVFNILMLVLAVAVSRGGLPVHFLDGLITGLHYTIGITTPTPQQVRRAAVVWILSMLVIVDVLFALVRWVI
jgi:hypothetical protein